MICLQWFTSKHIDVSKQVPASKETVLAFLAIYRQIRDFGLLFGDGKFELAIYRQLPKFRDFEPQRLAKSAKFEKQWRFWRYWIISG